MKRLVYVAAILLASPAIAGVVFHESIVESAEQLNSLERHVAREHLHGVDLAALEEWGRLGDVPCVPAANGFGRVVRFDP